MTQSQLLLFEDNFIYPKSQLLDNVKGLIKMYEKGLLGGEVMPEDAKPDIIAIDSRENYLFLTLPMALNYQRNSYRLWEAAAKTYLDTETRQVFYPEIVVNMPDEILKESLLKYKLAIQPNKHVQIWRTLCATLFNQFNGDIRQLFSNCNHDVIDIGNYVRVQYKQKFPYLSGHKIFNYWLHVMETYTPSTFAHRSEITVAPDTHIIQASLRLNLISGSFEEIAQKRSIVSEAWRTALINTDISPIDIHTPLWLWSRKGFPQIKDQ